MVTTSGYPLAAQNHRKDQLGPVSWPAGRLDHGLDPAWFSGFFKRLDHAERPGVLYRAKRV